MVNNSNDIAIGFVLYNPELAFFNRLELLINSGHKPFIYDNSPKLFKINSLECHYYSSDKNRGLGVGLKVICSKAYELGYKGLIIFDQDTSFNKITLTIIKSFYSEHHEMLTQSYTSVVFDSEEYVNQEQIDYKKFKNTFLSRNSGSLFILKNLKEIGWHNPSYFVDGIDYEYNLRSILNGYKVAKFTQTSGFDHISEQGDANYKLFNYNLKFRRYKWNRIKDYLKSSIRIMYNALRYLQIKFFILIFRQLLIYIFTQLTIFIISSILKMDQQR